MEKLDEAKTKRLYDIATSFHALSTSPKDKAYFQGYLTGLRRQMTGALRANDFEAEIFIALAKKPDTISQELGRGYKDALAGVEIVAGVG